MIGALLLAAAGGGTAPTAARALDCAPTDYICQQYAADQGTQAADANQLTTIQNEIKRSVAPLMSAARISQRR